MLNSVYPVSHLHLSTNRLTSLMNMLRQELLFGVGSSALLAHRDSGLGFGGAQTSGLEVSGILSEKGSELRWRIGHWS